MLKGIKIMLTHIKVQLLTQKLSLLHAYLSCSYPFKLIRFVVFIGSSSGPGLRGEKEYREPWVGKSCNDMSLSTWLVVQELKFLFLLNSLAGLLQLLSCNSSSKETIFRKSRYTIQFIFVENLQLLIIPLYPLA